MSNVIYVLNAASVGVFGILLSASFCELDWTPARRRAPPSAQSVWAAQVPLWV